VNYHLKLQPHCSTQLFELFYQADAALSAVYSDFHGQYIAHYLATCSAISEWIKSHPNWGTFLCPSSSISGKIWGILYLSSYRKGMISASYSKI
jgi:hypothetical protein